MSLKALSESTGFSVSTVSKVLSGKSEISEKTRRIIIDNAKEMGIYEKYSKFKPGTYTIALIVPEFKSEYYTEIISEFSDCLKKRGAVLTVAETGFDPERTKALFSYFAYSANTDGVIIMSDASLVKNPDRFPTLIIGTDSPELTYDCVQFDIENAVISLVKYLKDNGHRKIAYIGEELTTKKNDCFISAMRRLALTVDRDLIKINSLRFEAAGYTAMNEILESKKRPTAVVAAYDYVAIGAIKSIREHSLKVPDDISVVGMDNISAGETLSTPLTSVSVSPHEGTDTIIDMLLKKIDNKYIRIKSDTMVHPKLIERESVKKITAE